MIRPASVTAVFVLVSTLFITGCSSGSGNGQSETGSGNPENPQTEAASDKEPRLTFSVGTIGDTRQITDPDSAVIAAETQAVEWNNSASRPMVHLARIDKDETTVVQLKGTLGTPNEDGLFRAIVTCGTNEGVFLDAASPPLETVDAAIDLLLLVRSDPTELKNIASDWPQADQ